MNHTITILAARFHPDQHGGVETRLYQTARHLVMRGLEVRVHTENRCGAPAEETLMPGLNVTRFAPIEPGLLWRWPGMAKVHGWRRHLRRHIAPQGWIWASDPFTATAVIRLGLRDRLLYNPAACVAGMRHVGHEHVHVTTMQLPRHVGWLDRYASRSARHMLLSSRNLAGQYARFYGGRGGISIIPPAANAAHVGKGAQRAAERKAARMQWQIDSDAFTLGFVGRLDPCKGVDHILEAMAMQPLHPRAKLLIAGRGPDEARLRAITERLNLSRHVIWAGHLPDPTRAYAAMDVLVMPSLYEAFGLAATEAMAAGTPVIGRRANRMNVLTAFDEIIDHDRTGWLCDAEQVADLGELIGSLQNDPARCRHCGAEAARQAQRWTWTDYARTVMRMFQEATSGGDATARSAATAASRRHAA